VAEWILREILKKNELNVRKRGGKVTCRISLQLVQPGSFLYKYFFSNENSLFGPWGNHTRDHVVSESFTILMRL
jgi:hypothetical protein